VEAAVVATIAAAAFGTYVSAIHELPARRATFGPVSATSVAWR
jgi:hypothetical protein